MKISVEKRTQIKIKQRHYFVLKDTCEEWCLFISKFKSSLKKIKNEKKIKLNIYLYYYLKAKYVKCIKIVLTKEKGRGNCLSKKSLKERKKSRHSNSSPQMEFFPLTKKWNLVKNKFIKLIEYVAAVNYIHTRICCYDKRLNLKIKELKTENDQRKEKGKLGLNL